MTPMSDKPAKRFEQHLQEVELAVKSLEGGKLGLEESIDKYEQGIKALRECYGILEKAEKKIQMLVREKDGTLAARDFEGGSPAPEEKKPRKKPDPPKEGEDLPF
jgi:exodeoxyribonuclease VII small subunit